MAKDAPTPDQPGSVNLSPHPLVSKLHTDLDNPPNLVTLVGYLGPSKKPDSTRLYQDLTFRNYYEVPSASITATTPVDAEDPNSPTVIHVPASTTLEAVSTTSQSVEAGFLKGAITSSYLGSAAALPGAGQAAWWTGCCKASKTDVRAHVAGQAQAGMDCVCIALSAFGNTLAGQAQGPLDCVQITNTNVCTVSGVFSVCCAQAAAGQAQAGMNCIQITCTICCTMTGGNNYGQAAAGQAQAPAFPTVQQCIPTVQCVPTLVLCTGLPVTCTAAGAGQAQAPATFPTLQCIPTVQCVPTLALCPPPTIQCPATLNCGGAGAVGRA
jgi:hypothetical protein